MGVDLRNDRAVSRWKETQDFRIKMDIIRRERELGLLADEKIAMSRYDELTKEELQVLIRGDLIDDT